MSTGTSLLEHLGRVPDPRIKRTQRHELMDILVIALCAVIGGAEPFAQVRNAALELLESFHEPPFQFLWKQNISVIYDTARLKTRCFRAPNSCLQ